MIRGAEFSGLGICVSARTARWRSIHRNSDSRCKPITLRWWLTLDDSRYPRRGQWCGAVYAERPGGSHRFLRQRFAVDG